MKNEFILAINSLCTERGLSRDVVLEAIEAALISAYRKSPHGTLLNVTAQMDPNTGKAILLAEKEVVEKVDDDQLQITLDKSRVINPQANIGDTVVVEVTPGDFGRIAAQTAKQVIMQRIREAERDQLYENFAERQGDIINGTVQNVSPQGVSLSLGKTEALLPRSEQIPTERYGYNQRVRALVMEVNRTARGPQIVVSRTHRDLLKRLLELEVPEIYNGTVEIMAIAREAGSRSKVAVRARQEGIDPVGSCVGMRGVRIQSIVNELSGEKIDVVEWSVDTPRFIANALSPATVVRVDLHDASEGKTASVIVPDRQLSLAIGKEGQNARLAAKLTGWRIDIKSESEAIAEAERRMAEMAARVERDAEVARARALLAQAEAASKSESVAAEAAVVEVAQPEPATAVVVEPEPITASQTAPEAMVVAEIAKQPEPEPAPAPVPIYDRPKLLRPLTPLKDLALTPEEELGKGKKKGKKGRDVRDESAAPKKRKGGSRHREDWDGDVYVGRLADIGEPDLTEDEK